MMDEALPTNGLPAVGPASAKLLIRDRAIGDIHGFTCPDPVCRRDVTLKAMNSTSVRVHFLAVGGHADTCEYRDERDDDLGPRTNGSTITLSGEIVIVAGGLDDSEARGGSGEMRAIPPAENRRVVSRLKFRQFFDHARNMTSRQLSTNTAKLEGEPRLLSYLFVPARWIAHAAVQDAVVRWPEWAGASKYWNLSESPIVVFGEAVLGVGTLPPHIRWQTGDGGRDVILPADGALFARSKFRRRFQRELGAVNWNGERSVRCFAAALGTLVGDGNEIRVRLLGSYEDALFLPVAEAPWPEMDVVLNDKNVELAFYLMDEQERERRAEAARADAARRPIYDKKSVQPARPSQHLASHATRPASSSPPVHVVRVPTPIDFVPSSLSNGLVKTREGSPTVPFIIIICTALCLVGIFLKMVL